ncbi:hypothetical protein [Sphingomonas faeni]|uniref:hypothetical protein n=1 Tax=Sphingomonas faeni TaxID=185950 RepID=UPI00277D281A|nr:hypothetical protein [Sphingomonas faeni]MDQ0839401.1 membrane-associated PAP2 superfamily phosphatase [Sphingomonas faeni]
MATPPTGAPRYMPTKGDRAYRDFMFADGDRNPFEESILLQDISHAYLAAMLSSNSGPTSMSIKALLDAEMTRRGGLVAHRANLIASLSLGISGVSLIVAIVAAVIAR